MHIVIVGYGMAGSRLATELLARDRTARVTILGDEGHAAYNRIQLSNLLAGKTRPEAMWLPVPRGEHLRIRPHRAAMAIDPQRSVVTDDTGTEHRYDRLVLATGARPFVPPLRDLTDPLVLRTLDDCQHIAKQAAEASTALVLGGGLLGIEAARALAAKGLAVTVVHAADRLMNLQLDHQSSAMLEAALADHGITTVLDAAAVAAIDGNRGLRLADGRELTADLLLVSCGVRPRTELAGQAGLDVGKGVTVDSRLRTSDPTIHAIGDCAFHPGSVPGLLAPAWEQAKVLADVLLGDPAAEYRPTPPVTRLKAEGIDLAAMGPCPTSSPTGRLDPETVVFADPANGRYARLVVRDGRLVSAIMLGDQPAVGTVIQHFDRGTPMPGDLRDLLLRRPGSGPADHGGQPGDTTSPALMPDSAVVCRCNGVAKRALTEAWLRGERDLRAATRAGTGCGGCGGTVDGIAAWLSRIDQSDSKRMPTANTFRSPPCSTRPRQELRLPG